MAETANSAINQQKIWLSGFDNWLNLDLNLAW